MTFAWEVALEAKRYGRVILAGGLNCGNVRQAIETARPYAVDVSSGVEAEPGKKDPIWLAEFIRQVKSSPSHT
jgi:phosphoribosylanthranilate isomerase